jgi:predicted small lipoprotein YifL
MKRVLCAILAAVLLLSVAGCGEKKPEGFQIPKVDAFSVG